MNDASVTIRNEAIAAFRGLRIVAVVWGVCGGQLVTTDNKVFAKAAWHLIPFMVLLYVVAFLDRVNVGFAALTMNKDLALDATMFGWAGGIFFFGYFVFEVPSNVLLERVGARIWISRIMLTWGIVSMATAFAGGLTSLMILRFLLGVAEAGFFPGMVLYLTYWFPQATRARFIAMFLAAVPLANVLGAPASGYILGAEGALHLHGWQWMFLLEGIPSVLLGIAVLILLPDRPAKAAWLSEDEKQVMEAALAAEPPRVHTAFWPMLRDPRVWLLTIPDFGIVLGLYGLNLWLPQIVKAMGYSNIGTGFVVSGLYLVSVIAMVLWGMASDRRQERIFHIAAAALLGAAGFVLAALLHSPAGILAALTVASIGVYAALSVFWTLPTSFLGGTAAAGGIALINSFSNLGGFVGPTVMGWLKQHTGGYAAGFGVLAAGLIVAAVLVVAIGRTLSFAGRAAALERFTRLNA
jgi:ACS family tartrate transporter-like MFS transporter